MCIGFHHFVPASQSGHRPLTPTRDAQGPTTTETRQWQAPRSKDVARIPINVETLPFAVDLLTWCFIDMTDVGGRLALMWVKTLGSATFTAQ